MVALRAAPAMDSDPPRRAARWIRQHTARRATPHSRRASRRRIPRTRAPAPHCRRRMAPTDPVCASASAARSTRDTARRRAWRLARTGRATAPRPPDRWPAESPGVGRWWRRRATGVAGLPAAADPARPVSKKRRGNVGNHTSFSREVAFGPGAMHRVLGLCPGLPGTGHCGVHKCLWQKDLWVSRHARARGQARRKWH